MDGSDDGLPSVEELGAFLADGNDDRDFLEEMRPMWEAARVEALAEQGRLLGEAQSPDAETRRAAATGLGRNSRARSRTSITMLERLVRDPVPKVQRAAIDAIPTKDIELPATLVTALIDALDDDGLADSAAEILARIGPPAAAAAPALLRRLEKPAFHDRRNALDHLAAIGAATDTVLDAVRRRLSDDDAIVRAHAAVALSHLDSGDKGYLVPVIEAGLRCTIEPNWGEGGAADVRVMSARALVRTAPAGVHLRPMLRAMLGAESSWERQAAAEALDAFAILEPLASPGQGDSDER